MQLSQKHHGFFLFRYKRDAGKPPRFLLGLARDEDVKRWLLDGLPSYNPFHPVMALRLKDVELIELAEDPHEKISDQGTWTFQNNNENSKDGILDVTINSNTLKGTWSFIHISDTPNYSRWVLMRKRRWVSHGAIKFFLRSYTKLGLLHERTLHPEHQGHHTVMTGLKALAVLPMVALGIGAQPKSAAAASLSPENLPAADIVETAPENQMSNEGGGNAGAIQRPEDKRDDGDKDDRPEYQPEQIAVKSAATAAAFDFSTQKAVAAAGIAAQRPGQPQPSQQQPAFAGESITLPNYNPPIAVNTLATAPTAYAPPSAGFLERRAPPVGSAVSLAAAGAAGNMPAPRPQGARTEPLAPMRPGASEPPAGSQVDGGTPLITAPGPQGVIAHGPVVINPPDTVPRNTGDAGPRIAAAGIATPKAIPPEPGTGMATYELGQNPNPNIPQAASVANGSILSTRPLQPAPGEFARTAAVASPAAGAVASGATTIINQGGGPSAPQAGGSTKQQSPGGGGGQGETKDGGQSGDKGEGGSQGGKGEAKGGGEGKGGQGESKGGAKSESKNEGQSQTIILESNSQRVAEYYAAHADIILPALQGRPVQATSIHDTDNKKAEYVKVSTPDALAELAQKGRVELQVPAIHTKDKLPDQVTFDLDPGPYSSWERVVKSAEYIREELKEQGLESFVQATGGKGLHVVVPFAAGESDEHIQHFVQQISESAAAHHDDILTTDPEDTDREKVLINVAHNDNSAPVIAPYSVRASGNNAIAVPLDWKELHDMPAPDFYTLENIDSRLQPDFKDPWRRMMQLDQKLPHAEPATPAPSNDLEPQ